MRVLEREDTYAHMYNRQPPMPPEWERDILSTPGHLSGLVSRGFARLSEARLGPLGFGVGQIPVLVALRDGHAKTQKELARFARVKQPPMAQMLARMETAGLIHRAPDPNDGRSQIIGLTDLARARLPQASAMLLAGNQEAVRGFTEDEVVVLTGLLTRLIENLDQIAPTDA